MPEPRRLLICVDFLAQGGAQRQLALLAEALPERWERRVWAIHGGPYEEVLRRAGVAVETHPRRSRWDVRWMVALWRTIVNERPDVVLSWGWLCTMAAGPLCRALGVPLVDCTIRSGGRASSRHEARQLARLWARRVVANSRAGLEYAGVAATKGRVVHNGFDPARFALCDGGRGGDDTAPHAAVSKSAHPFTVIMTARMSPQKDWDTFCGAARRLDAAEPGAWRFVALGEGAERERLLRDYAGLVAAGVLVVPPPVMEVVPHLLHADAGALFTHPGRLEEGISNSIMEYMACRLPVVCGDNGGNRELVVESETGLIVPDEDVEAAADALRRLREEPETARRLGEAGRRRLEAEFSVGTMVDRFVGLFEEVLAGTHRPRVELRVAPRRDPRAPLVVFEDDFGTRDEGHAVVAWGLAEAALAQGGGYLAMPSMLRVVRSWRGVWRRLPTAVAALARTRRVAAAPLLVYAPYAALTLGTIARVPLLRALTGRDRVVIVSLIDRRLTEPGRGPKARLKLRALDALRTWGVPVVTVDEAYATRLLEAGVEARAVTPGLDAGRFAPRRPGEREAARETLGLDPDRPVVLHVGHLSWARGLEALVELAADPALQVVMVASTSTAAGPGVAASLTDAGVRLIHEKLGDVRLAYCAADVYVFPTNDPDAVIGLPLTVLEAAAVGVPVVTFPVGDLARRLPASPAVVFASDRAGLLAAVRDLVAAIGTGSPATKDGSDAGPAGASPLATWDDMLREVVAAGRGEPG